ncbi:unnamed protein product, partial [Staurois parvus]
GGVPAGEGVPGDRSQLWDWGRNRHPLCRPGGPTGPKWKKPGEAAGDGPALRGDLWPEAPPGPRRSDRDEKVVQQIVEETVGHFGQLDVLVNCGGIMALGSSENTTLEDYDRLMNINVRSVFYLSQLAVPHLIKTKGNIVNVSSVAV